MKKILFFLLISTAALSQPYNGTTIRGVNYTVNAANSSTANLASGATFTGTITNVTTGEPNIQVSVATDQPMEVSLDQFNDAGGTLVLPVTHWDVTTTGLNQNVNLVGNFFRIRVKNVGIATTANFSVQVTTGLMTMGARNYITAPLGTDEGMGVRSVPQLNWRTTFSKVLAATWDTEYWARPILGTGMATSQSAGNGVITAGTTANSETILRSRRNFTGSFLIRAQTQLSQRIVNNNFVVELVDVIGDGLVLTAVSATSCTVTIPNNPFTSENVGQFMNIGAIVAGSIPGTLVPGRYAIASVAGNVVTFTVSGWTGATSGTGTCSLFGWNYHQLIYSGTTATNVTYDAQRKGWASGGTTATISTTAAPGHMAVMGSDDGNAFLADQLVASATTLPITTRASRVVNIADESADLWLQIRVLNGTTAPASGTTWTIGTIVVENYASQQVTLASSKAQGANTTQPVSVLNTPAVTVSSGTITTVTTTGTVTTLANGQTAHSAASTGSPLRIAGRVTETTQATQDQTRVAGDADNLQTTTAGQLINKLFSTAEVDWHYSAAASGIVSSTTAVTIRAASGTAGIRSYITGIEIGAYGAGTATELAIRDGSAGTVIWRMQIPAAGLTAPVTVNFITPLRSTANTLLEVVTLTSSATPVFFNAHGYTSF